MPFLRVCIPRLVFIGMRMRNTKLAKYSQVIRGVGGFINWSEHRETQTIYHYIDFIS